MIYHLVSLFVSYKLKLDTPKSSRPLKGLGDTYLAKGEKDKARKAYERASSMN